MPGYDARETILQQILVELGKVPGFMAVYRNRGAVPPKDPVSSAPLLPACVLLDGKEEPQGDKFQNQSRRGKMPEQTINMYPEIFIVLPPSLTPDNAGVGEALSSFRIQIIKALSKSVNILSLLGPNGGISYMGFESDMQQGGDKIGQMRLDFCFAYVFDPSVL